MLDDFRQTFPSDFNGPATKRAHAWLHAISFLSRHPRREMAAPLGGEMRGSATLNGECTRSGKSARRLLA